MTQSTSNTGARFSVGSLLALMLVVAFCMAAMGLLVQAHLGELQGVFWFSPYTSMMPMGLMIVVYWGILIYRGISKLMKN